MKPPPFDYLAPATLDEALEILDQRGWDAKILAGGQSLVPLLNFRLAAPAVLVDLNRIGGLDGIEETPDGGLRIGAMARQRALEVSPEVAARDPLLAEAVPLIAHPQIRNRGTAGGSLAHADPSAELPVVALARDARFHLRRHGGERQVAARDFYVGLMTTALEPQEVLVEIELPPLAAATGTAFVEFARRHGDYGLLGVAAVVTGDGGSSDCTAARLVYMSAGEIPMEAREAAALLVRDGLSDEAIAEAADLAATREIEPTSDIHASAAYKRHLARVLTRRALTVARERMAA